MARYKIGYMSAPPILSYASSRPVRTAQAMLWLFGTSALFGVCEWLTEYGCQGLYVRHRIRAAASSYRAMKAEDQFFYDMLIETAIAFVVAIIFFAGQAWAYPWRQARVRTVWPLIIVLGALVSLMGWGMWFYSVGDGINALVRLGSALLFGAIASWARRVER